MPDKNKLILGTNDDTYIAADDAGNIILQHEGGNRLSMSNTSITPASNEQIDLGSATNKFKDLYLSSDSIFIGNTKLSSDPTTGALSTVVADEQGEFTADAAPVGGGGGGKFYDWKGSTKNVAANDPTNINSTISKLSMESLYDSMVIQQNGSGTGLVEVIWGNYLGNPDSNQVSVIDSVPLSSGNYDDQSAFITDENGDDLSAFLVNKMEEENLQILNFEFSISARIQIQDPAKAAYISYFRGGQYNNLTNVTSVPLYTWNQDYMYAFKSVAAASHWSGGHTRGIMMGFMEDYSLYENYLSWVAGESFSGGYGFNTLGKTSGGYGQPNVFDGINLKSLYADLGSRRCLDIDMRLHNPGSNLASADPAIMGAIDINDLAGYFDLQDGIVFDMMVKLK